MVPDTLEPEGAQAERPGDAACLSDALAQAVAATIAVWRPLASSPVQAGTPKQWVINLACHFAIECAEAVLLLVRAQYSHQALLLVRPLYELFINVRYAEKAADPEAQFERLWDYRWHEAGRLLEANVPDPGGSCPPAIWADVQAARAKHGWDRKTRDWCEKHRDLCSRAGHLRLQDTYDSAYRLLSDTSHATAFGLGLTALLTPGGGMVLADLERNRLAALGTVGDLLPHFVQWSVDEFAPADAENVRSAIDGIWAPVHPLVVASTALSTGGAEHDTGGEV